MDGLRPASSPPARTGDVTVGVAGKYANLRDAYASIDKALEHCSAHLGTHIELHWIDTTDINDGQRRAAKLTDLDAVIVPGGFGTRGVEGKIACVRHCRENLIPYLGICLGFQVAVIEFARNVLGLSDANSTEFSPASKSPVISELPEQKRDRGAGRHDASGRAGRDRSRPARSRRSSTAASARSASASAIATRSSPSYIDQPEAAGMVFSGRHPNRPIMQMLELPSTLAPSGPGVRASAGSASTIAEKPGVTHPFFVAGQFHPELTGRPLRPQPMFMGLIAAAIARKYGTTIDRNDLWADDLRRWTRLTSARGQATTSV